MKGFFLTLLTMLCTISCHAHIIQIDNLDLFEKAVEQSNQQSLVLFDVDETLIIPKDLILRPTALNIWNKYAKETIENPAIRAPEKGDKEYILGQIFSKIEFEIVDPKVIDIISSLQERRIKTIAFTKMRTGALGALPSLEDWRIDQLNEHNIDFSLAFPQHSEIKIEPLQPNGRTSLFKQGVLCSNKQDKGPVLIAFLERLDWKPSKVFFLDNRMDYLQSVETALEGTGIEFIGFHYREMERRPCTVDENIAKYQLEHLAKTGIWLSDSETLQLLKRSESTPLLQWMPQQIQKLQEIQSAIEKSGCDPLIIFDVDDVLISTIDIFNHPEGRTIFLSLIHQEIAQAKTEEENQKLENHLSLLFLKPERVLVEKSAPSFIKQLQEKGLKVIALTSCRTGRFGVIRRVEQWRIDELKAFNIDFSLAFPTFARFKLKKIAKNNRPAPLFEKGILFSQGYSKGEVLEAFLKKADWMPSKVIFVDDLTENLYSVKQHLDALGVPYAGFHYTGASFLQKKINPALIEFQLGHLLNNEEWVSDKEAMKLMEERVIPSQSAEISPMGSRS